MKRRIFLDMDGVLSDWESAVRAWYNKPLAPFQNWSIRYEEDFGMSADEFWAGLTEEFWESMPFTPEAEQILAITEPYKPIILTMPPRSAPGATGKLLWVKRNLPEFHHDRRVIMTLDKTLVGPRGDILIDDADHLIEQWVDAGGIGITVPRSYNKLRAKRDGVVEWIYFSLQYHLGQDF